jgi:hypothetical protein
MPYNELLYAVGFTACLAITGLVCGAILVELFKLAEK